MKGAVIITVQSKYTECQRKFDYINVDSYINRERYEFYLEWESYINQKEPTEDYSMLEELKELGVYI